MKIKKIKLELLYRRSSFIDLLFDVCAMDAYKFELIDENEAINIIDRFNKSFYISRYYFNNNLRMEFLEINTFLGVCLNIRSVFIDKNQKQLDELYDKFCKHAENVRNIAYKKLSVETFING